MVIIENGCLRKKKRHTIKKNNNNQGVVWVIEVENQKKGCIRKKME